MVVLEPFFMYFTGVTEGFGVVNPVFFARDGVHLNKLGHHKYFSSLRGAVLRCIRIFSAR